MRNRKWWILFVMVSVLAVLLAACGGDDDDNGDDGDVIEPIDEGAVADVVIENDAFTPASIDVEAGSTVTWFNNDDEAHTVTSGAPGAPDGFFDSGNVDANGSFSFTFDQPGTYAYFCSIHPNMTGTVNVTAAEGEGIEIDETEIETAVPGG